MMFLHWLQTVHSGGVPAALFGFLLLISVSFVPAVPIPVIITAMGAVFPLWVTVCVSWLAIVIGAIAKFLLERWLLQRHVNRYLARYRYWSQVLRIVDRHGFVAVVVTRMIPFFPSAGVNLAAAVTRMSFSVYASATAIGLFPTALAFGFAGHQISRGGPAGWVIAFTYLAVAGLVAWQLVRAIRSGSD